MQIESGSDENSPAKQWHLGSIGQSQSLVNSGTPGTRCGEETSRQQEDVLQQEVPRLAATNEEMDAAESTVCLRDRSWRALNHQPAGFQQPAQQYQQAARDQTQVAIRKLTWFRNS